MEFVTLYSKLAKLICEDGNDDLDPEIVIKDSLELRESFRCCVCMNMAVDPYLKESDDCEHVLCKECIGGEIKPTCTACPLDDEEVNYEEHKLLKGVLVSFKSLCPLISNLPFYRKLVVADGLTDTETNFCEMIIQLSNPEKTYETSEMTSELDEGVFKTPFPVTSVPSPVLKVAKNISEGVFKRSFPVTSVPGTVLQVDENDPTTVVLELPPSIPLKPQFPFKMWDEPGPSSSTLESRPIALSLSSSNEIPDDNLPQEPPEDIWDVVLYLLSTVEILEKYSKESDTPILMPPFKNVAMSTSFTVVTNCDQGCILHFACPSAIDTVSNSIMSLPTSSSAIVPTFCSDSSTAVNPSSTKPDNQDLKTPLFVLTVVSVRASQTANPSVSVANCSSSVDSSVFPSTASQTENLNISGPNCSGPVDPSDPDSFAFLSTSSSIVPTSCSESSTTVNSSPFELDNQALNTPLFLPSPFPSTGSQTENPTIPGENYCGPIDPSARSSTASQTDNPSISMPNSSGHVDLSTFSSVATQTDNSYIRWIKWPGPVDPANPTSEERIHSLNNLFLRRLGLFPENKRNEPEDSSFHKRAPTSALEPTCSSKKCK